MSITTKTGDGGSTGLIGGERVSKTDPRIECLGTLDELTAHLGLARALSANQNLREWLEKLQRELFQVASAVATPHQLASEPPELTAATAAIEAEIHRIEAMPQMLPGWSVPGRTPDGAAIDVARTVCRRAERAATAVWEHGLLSHPAILTYLNRLSDLLWLLGRLAEGPNSTEEAGWDRSR